MKILLPIYGDIGFYELFVLACYLKALCFALYYKAVFGMVKAKLYTAVFILQRLIDRSNAFTSMP